MNSGNSILVGCLGSVAWVRIDGQANHENAASVRAFLWGRFEKGWKKFVIDLEHCPGMDSTFIGMLYRFAASLIEADEEGTVDLISAGERNERSIRKLGLDTLLRIDPEGLVWRRERDLVVENLSQPVDTVALDRSEKAQLVLDAHEALVEANEQNRSRFCDVIEFLQKDLARESADH